MNDCLQLFWIKGVLFNTFERQTNYYYEVFEEYFDAIGCNGGD